MAIFVPLQCPALIVRRRVPLATIRTWLFASLNALPRRTLFVFLGSLFASLRIDLAELAAVQAGDVGELTSYFKNRRIDKFAAALGKEVLP